MFSNLRDLADTLEEIDQKNCELFDVYKLALVSIEAYLVQSANEAFV